MPTAVWTAAGAKPKTYTKPCLIRQQHEDPPEPNPPSLPQPDYAALRGLPAHRVGMPPPPAFGPPAANPPHNSAAQLNLGPLEAAFKFPETSRPATNYDHDDPRHIWTFRKKPETIASRPSSFPSPSIENAANESVVMDDVVIITFRTKYSYLRMTCALIT